LSEAYEHLLRHFATESGKGESQFYTPTGLSRVVAWVSDMPARYVQHSLRPWMWFSPVAPKSGGGEATLRSAMRQSA